MNLWRTCFIFLIVVTMWLGDLGIAFAAGPIGLLDAVRITLAENPNIQLQTKQGDISRGALQQASGQFDTALSLTAGRSGNNTPLTPKDSLSYRATELETKTTAYSVALNTPFRNGVVISPSISATSMTGTVNTLENLPAQNQGSVNFAIIVPLLRGSGEAAAAGETAAKLQWEASQQDLRLTISQSVLTTVTAYWSFLVAKRNLDIARESEASVRQMVDDTRKLIAADELPAADLNLVSANLLGKTASRIAAERALIDARQGLGLAMGLPYPKIVALEVADGFPSLGSAFSGLENQRMRLVDLAMKRRPDLVAARLREDSARTLTSAAQTDLKPQLNVNLNAGYAGLAQGGGAGAWGGLTQNRTGANIGVSVSYQWPFDNNAARGKYLQQSASYDQSTLQVASVERSIGVGVESAVLGLTLSAMQLDQSQATVDLYRISLENEKTKYKLGTSTMIDVLTVTDQLLSARLANLGYQLNTLNALANLNFATGTLLAEDHAEQSIRMEQLVGVPRLN
jgi:outer membrane protein TolC